MKYLILAAILITSSAQCMVYMWRDSAGIAHYTNKVYEIPARYKLKAKNLYPEDADSRAMQSGTPIEQKTPEAKKEQAPAELLQHKSIAPVPSMRRVKKQRGNAAEE